MIKDEYRSVGFVGNKIKFMQLVTQPGIPGTHGEIVSYRREHTKSCKHAEGSLQNQVIATSTHLPEGIHEGSPICTGQSYEAMHYLFVGSRASFV
jgi:hypothetical protein